jgi:hypothetical protein
MKSCMSVLLTPLLLVAFMLTSCKTVTTLPAWAPTAPVAAAGEAIASANGAVVQFEKDKAAGFVPSPTLNAIMSDIQQALVIAQPAFDQWEQAARENAAAAEPVVLPTQLDRISADIAKIPSTTGAQ